MIIERFSPSETTGKVPLVIGMPGFISPVEGSRTEDILRDLSERGILGYSLRFKNIRSENDGKRVVCDFNLDNYVADLQEVVDMAMHDPRFDGKNLGVFASSISGSVFAYFIANNPTTPITAHVSVSPLMGWRYFANPQTRQALSRMPYIPITTEMDRTNGIERIVPIENLPELERVDGLGALKEYNPHGMKVRTLFGNQDKVSDPESIREYHRRLGGRAEDLLEFPCGHAIPNEISQNKITGFLEVALREAA